MTWTLTPLMLLGSARSPLYPWIHCTFNKPASSISDIQCRKVIEELSMRNNALCIFVFWCVWIQTTIVRKRVNVVNECERRMILNLSPDFPRNMRKTSVGHLSGRLAPRNSGGQAHFTLQKQGACAIADSCADLLCQSHLHFWQAGGLADWLCLGGQMWAIWPGQSGRSPCLRS